MRINVISLERTPERLAEFRKLNGHLKHVAVFKAVDGATLSQDDLAARGVIVPPIHYTNGTLGSMMSHTALWEHAATSGEITTVCEDDAIFNLAFERRGGTLAIEGTGSYGLVAGFPVPDTFDLAAVKFASATMQFNSSTDVLTVGDGTHSVSIELLGSHMATNFHLTSEGGGGTGTVVTDPPAGGTTSSVIG